MNRKQFALAAFAWLLVSLLIFGVSARGGNLKQALEDAMLVVGAVAFSVAMFGTFYTGIMWLLEEDE